MATLDGYPDWILARGFGGIETAASPGASVTSHDWPEGRRAPMASESARALLDAANDPESAPILVFLVGGAGNGKSKIATDLVKALGKPALEPGEAFARRVYTYAVAGGRTLRVVNDATIPPKEKSGLAPLAADIAASLEGNQHMLVCVNRGVLVGEIGLQPPGAGTPLGELAASMLKWLLGHGDTAPQEAAAWRLLPATGLDGSHYRFATIEQQGEPRAYVHVVYMDQASLLEPWPAASGDPRTVAAPLQVLKLKIMPVLKRVHAAADSAAFTEPLMAAAAGFLKEAREHSPGGLLDPIVANAEALTKPGPASAWCAIMRGAEIISGAHFSYRELWALTSHSLVGLPGAEGTARLASWVRQAASAAIGAGASKETCLSCLMALAELRTHMSLFGGSHLVPDLLRSRRWPAVHATNDALQALAAADPLFDFGPPNFDYQRLAQDIESIGEGKKPSDAIRSRDPEALCAWTGFDAVLEEAIWSFVKPDSLSGDIAPSDGPELKHRNAIIGWYGQYLFRLVAFSRGWAGYVGVVNTWQQSLQQAIDAGTLPADLNKSILRVLLMNQGDAQAAAQFALLRPRLEELAADESHVSVEVPVNDFDLQAFADGDQILVDVRLRGKPASRAVLDFHLVREAQARSGGHGFTDSLRLVEPRLERLRAGLLAHELKQGVSGRKPRLAFKHNTKFSV